MRCSIARALNVVGDPWTFLILRDVLNRGLHRFEEIQKDLGIATNVLTARLKKLTDEGVLKQRAYSQHPLRYEYHATPRAVELRPILLSLMAWGDKHLCGSEAPPVLMMHESCGHLTTPKVVCSQCDKPLTAGLRLVSAYSRKPSRRTKLRQEIKR